MKYTRLDSFLDSSVNLIYPYNEGKLEARYVSRDKDQLIIYLSTFNGCNQACRFCHLTKMKETEMDPVSIEDIVKQAEDVYKIYQEKGVTAKNVNYNFMARGEPLLNSNIIEWEIIHRKLSTLALNYNLQPKLNISTIFPKEFNLDNLKNFEKDNTNIYYSLYSLNENFRKRWIPKAHDPKVVIQALKNINNKIIIHGAFIKNENDSIEEAIDLVDKLKDLKNLSFNIVRYNPFDNGSKEADEERISDIAKIYSTIGNVQVVPRVGFDVKASCGMFI